jgi:hypothetical protein
MLPIRTIDALFLALVATLLAKEQEFRFEKPDAQTVDLMAEFNQWKSLPMTKEPNGTWRVKVSIPPGTYGYKFLVDGKGWVLDPNNSSRKTVDGVENSSIEITQDTLRHVASRTGGVSNVVTSPGVTDRFPMLLAAETGPTIAVEAGAAFVEQRLLPWPLPTWR